MKRQFLILFLFFTIKLTAQFGSQDSGGKLIPEQACYDVKFYEINLSIVPSDKTITGDVSITSKANVNFQMMILDLDQNFNISSIDWINSTDKITYSHEQGRIIISFPREIVKEEIIVLKITYNGQPRIPKRPPWDDGFIWSKTKDGKDWATLTCQGGGADIWIPCKDHPSDEPDSVSLHYTAPADLVCIGSGKFISANDNGNGTKTWNWFVSTPINNYCIMFYLGPYEKIEYVYTSVDGIKFPFTVWVIPESLEKAKSHAPQFIQHMKVMEELIGPYPFRADKYSVVETPHLGMEHQTAIAYGFGWKNHNNFEFDWLHHHEFSHEWWGNLVTAKDWSDFWIHEGTGTYMQPLYLEKVFGQDQYFAYLKSIKRFANTKPVAPRGEKTSGESYTLDVYYKGAWIIHTLRYYLGDEIFFKVFRRWAYPNSEMENVTDGSQCRLATTDEFLEIAENISGKKLDWFFEVYFRQAKLPTLNVKRDDDNVIFEWKTENDKPFYLPVTITIDGKEKNIDMKNGKAEIAVDNKSELKIDPLGWILMSVINN